jgi:hypothetical protein
MKRYTLQAQFQADMDCPKEVVMWNYYDHEHLVGTHYKLYDRARVVAERDDWALVYRSKRMPFLPFRTAGIGFQYMDGNTMKSFHKDSIGFFLETDIEFIDRPENRCTIRVTYRINTHPFFKVFEPFFKRLFEKWFWATWEEDAPMFCVAGRFTTWDSRSLAESTISTRRLQNPSISTRVNTYSTRPFEPHPQSRRSKASSGLSRRAWSSDTTSEIVPDPNLWFRRKKI